jgi:RNA polymerase sigma factor (TIGR02999 family)
MNDVTKILSAMGRGDLSSAERLLPLVYDELRKLAEARLAKEQPGQTLQATALVHEAYLRLVDSDCSVSFNSKGHFFVAASEAMRRILVDRARRKARPKHGGDRQRVDLEQDAAVDDDSSSEKLLALHQALDRFEREDPQKAQLVKLRYFVGMTLVEAGDVIGISRATAARHWTFAKAWLAAELEQTE